MEMFVVMFSTCLRSHFSKLLVVKKHPFYLLLLCNSPTLEHLQHFFNFCLLVNFVSSSEYTDLRTTNVICVARECSPQKNLLETPVFVSSVSRSEKTEEEQARQWLHENQSTIHPRLQLFHTVYISNLEMRNILKKWWWVWH